MRMKTTMTSEHPNPFVGPRPFQRGEKLFGRSREVRELFYLLTAERIVWLHSPSGAGKTSLVDASLAPRLQRDGFEVCPTIRVNLDLSGHDMHELDNPPNRYLLSTLVSLEEGLPDDQRRPPEELATLSLSEYLDQRCASEPTAASSVLIFDQFEEILTVDPLQVEQKRAFFKEVGDALRDENLWALFSLREEFLAQLEPYIDLIPTRWSNTFHLDLLGDKAVGEVLQKTAKLGGRKFTDAAAKALFEDLARTKVQQPDGTFREQAGHHVEPVQLQVVCRRLWDEMPMGDLVIDKDDLHRFGDVSEALGAYYSDAVSRITDGNQALERGIRDWFSKRLITKTGIRAQVLRGKGESEGLANGVVEQLLDTHLVRGEKRAGATWYELAHDRLVQPVHESNEEWLKEHLQPFQRQAAAWVEQGAPPDGGSFLLRGKELKQALAWTVGNEELVSDAENQLLQISKTARTRRLWTWTAVGIVAAIVVASGISSVFFGLQALQKEREAFHQLAVMNVNKAVDERNKDALLNAAHYFSRASEAFFKAKEPKFAANLELARKSIYRNLMLKLEVGHAESVSGALFSADGKRILTWGNDGVRVWDAATGEAVTTLLKQEGGISGAEFSADGKRILTLSSLDDTAWLMDISIDTKWPEDQRVLRTEVETGTELTRTGEVSALSADAWQQKKWCEYDKILHDLDRITPEQWQTSQRLCRELKERNKAGVPDD
jgi:hypothetical protein